MSHSGNKARLPLHACIDCVIKKGSSSEHSTFWFRTPVASMKERTRCCIPWELMCADLGFDWYRSTDYRQLGFILNMERSKFIVAYFFLFFSKRLGGAKFPGSSLSYASEFCFVCSKTNYFNSFWLFSRLCEGKNKINFPLTSIFTWSPGWFSSWCVETIVVYNAKCVLDKQLF